MLIERILRNSKPLKAWFLIPFACFFMSKWILEDLDKPDPYMDLYYRRQYRALFTEFQMMYSILLAILLFGLIYNILIK